MSERADDGLDAIFGSDSHDERFLQSLEDARHRSALLTELVDARRRMRLTQKDVAARMGTQQSTISDLEGGGTDPRLSTLQRYARAVDCRLDVHIAHRRVFSSEDSRAFGGYRIVTSTGPVAISDQSNILPLEMNKLVVK